MDAREALAGSLQPLDPVTSNLEPVLRHFIAGGIEFRPHLRVLREYLWLYALG